MRLSYFVLVTFVLSIFSTHAYGQVTAIKAGRLIDPASGTASVNQIILIEKDKITAIGGDIAIPAGATVIDLSRSTVLPGLFDMHTHLCLDVQSARDGGRYYYTTLNDPDTFRAINGVVNARAMLDAGFTTVRDVGNEDNYACTSVRLAIARNMIPRRTVGHTRARTTPPKQVSLRSNTDST